MSTITVSHSKAESSVPKKIKKGPKEVVKHKNDKLKKEQLASFEQGLSEVILISRGKMEGTPLSELWDE